MKKLCVDTESKSVKREAENNLTLLPLDAAENIVLFLDFTDFYQLTRVCKYYNSIFFGELKICNKLAWKHQYQNMRRQLDDVLNHQRLFSSSYQWRIRHYPTEGLLPAPLDDSINSPLDDKNNFDRVKDLYCNVKFLIFNLKNQLKCFKQWWMNNYSYEDSNKAMLICYDPPHSCQSRCLFIDGDIANFNSNDDICDRMCKNPIINFISSPSSSTVSSFSPSIVSNPSPSIVSNPSITFDSNPSTTSNLASKEETELPLCGKHLESYKMGKIRPNYMPYDLRPACSKASPYCCMWYYSTIIGANYLPKYKHHQIPPFINKVDRDFKSITRFCKDVYDIVMSYLKNKLILNIELYLGGKYEGYEEDVKEYNNYRICEYCGTIGALWYSINSFPFSIRLHTFYKYNVHELIYLCNGKCAWNFMLKYIDYYTPFLNFPTPAKLEYKTGFDFQSRSNFNSNSESKFYSTEVLDATLKNITDLRSMGVSLMQFKSYYGRDRYGYPKNSRSIIPIVDISSKFKLTFDEIKSMAFFDTGRARKDYMAGKDYTAGENNKDVKETEKKKYNIKFINEQTQLAHNLQYLSIPCVFVQNYNTFNFSSFAEILALRESSPFVLAEKCVVVDIYNQLHFGPAFFYYVYSLTHQDYCNNKGCWTYLPKSFIMQIKLVSKLCTK